MWQLVFSCFPGELCWMRFTLQKTLLVKLNLARKNKTVFISFRFGDIVLSIVAHKTKIIPF
jgi:hypothetical protein